MQQIQLLQMISQLQRDNQLAGSLSGSRDAAAQADLAKADLLRLQAMQMAGGGGGRGVGVL